MANLAKRIKELRTAAGMSQDEFAHAVGVSRSAVSMYERAEREPSFRILEVIAARFSVDMNYLLSDTPPPAGAIPAWAASLGERLQATGESSGLTGGCAEGEEASAGVFREHYGPPYGTPLEEILEDILEAMQKNPKLGLLFSRSAKMNDVDVDLMLKMVERIHGDE